MAPEARRQALVDATLPLLLEHGRAVSTKQIAEAAGVAEGTIFRAFDSKDDLIRATIEAALDLEPFLDVLATVDPGLGLRARLVQMVVHLQHRFAGVFALMTVMGMTGPPRAAKHMAADRRRIEEALVALVEPDADRLSCSPNELVHLMRLLTFSGTHPHLSDGRPLTPEQIVDTLLDGLLRTDARC